MRESMNTASGSRRPLKSRTTAWAVFFSRSMLALGLRPNAVSLLSIGCSAVAGAAALMTAHSTHAWAWWLLAAAGIQLRLFCNMMDGLLAVEGGLKSPTGDLYNEIPDRIDDALILVPLGYAAGTDWGISLGWAAMGGAMLTAYIRALGASLTGKHDFCGPMAKPHRMFAITVGCLSMMAIDIMNVQVPRLMVWCLVIMNAGIVITCWRRTAHLAHALTQRPTE